MPNTVRQIRTQDETLYDIEAPKLVETNEYKVKELSVENTGTSTSAVVNLKASDKNSADVNGVVELNAKGNLAVESLSKHVNIEAAQGIQIKPTTNVIFDSSRRIKNNNGNEVHLEFKFDDYKNPPKEEYVGKDGNDEPYAELKVEARNIDLRCLDHGGVAIQPCGKDSNDFENKIKFESSRTSALGVTPVTYSTEGGKGLEFGTFNNEHTSLFTGDYRFNKDGNVYAVTRATPVTSSGKTDYPTQLDDFKDIIDNNLCASWEDIVKTAIVLKTFSQEEDLTFEKFVEILTSVFNEEETPVL